jgi:uncharacterized Zn-finger protein
MKNEAEYVFNGNNHTTQYRRLHLQPGEVYNDPRCNTNGASMTAEPKILANASKVYQIKPKDLPLCCPMPNMTLWNSHPRVYLTLDEQGRAKCPYCSADFQMVEDKK